LWLQFEQEMSLHANEGSAKKRQLKEIKSSIKKFLEADRNNILIYCAYAQALHRLESYQVDFLLILHIDSERFYLSIVISWFLL